MKKLVATAVLAAFPLLASAGSNGVRFDAVVTQKGQPVAEQSVWVPFEQQAVIEVPGKVRVVATATAPSGERSSVAARIYYFADGAWILDWDTTMEANLGLTPSFEKDLGDKVHRVVVMPRASAKPSSGGIWQGRNLP